VRGIQEWSVCSKGIEFNGIKLGKYIAEDASNHDWITDRRIDESGAFDQSIADSATWFFST